MRAEIGVDDRAVDERGRKPGGDSLDACRLADGAGVDVEVVDRHVDLRRALVRRHGDLDAAPREDDDDGPGGDLQVQKR